MSSVPPRIVELVETFERNIESYKRQGYSEAQVRQQFINPFFEALGWDMQNKAGIAPAYSDVIHEDAIKVGGATKAPDYCFRIGGTRKFFLEAKKPSVDISSDISPAYQLRRYAWSAKLPLSILTDFEEFAVYDCQIRPSPDDKPSTGRIMLFTYKDYADKWEQIASIFSKDAVLKGAFDKYASEKTTKRGTTTVDKEFLAEIEGWRNELAKNIAIRNGKLSVYDLNFAVQKTIDRILFLRICEDRGIERNEQLSGLINGSRIYPRLFELFEKADEKYNSGIFHFRREKDRPEGPDELSAKLKVDDDVLKKIIRDLYYPCPYEFSVMPAEILGQVYEQFLGKVIRLTASHQAKVEEKPEVKKAGGVYYTPSYIVDYIVKNTVGKLLGASFNTLSEPVPSIVEGVEGSNYDRHCEAIGRGNPKSLTPKQIEKLKILDPACGSGSFLIGAYQYLLDFHRDYYAKEPSKHKKVIYQGKGKQWFLTIDEKKRILLNNIYGVDIDSQAVEVTKLSLLLKVLENETQESLRLFHERALPDLGNNIKCGNSLIGPDFYQKQQLTLFGDEQQRKINAFDWQKEFAPIFKQGGFDVVIGNPPWGADFSELEQAFLRKDYKTAEGRTIDSYTVFIESGLRRLRKGGTLSYITPDTFLRKDDHLSCRKLLLENTTIRELIETGPLFSQVRDTWCLVFNIAKCNPENNIKIRHRKISRFIVSAEERLSKFGEGAWDSEISVSQNTWSTRPKMIIGYLASEPAQKLIEKIESRMSLGQLSEKYRISRGEEGSKFAIEEDNNGGFLMVIPKDVERYTVADGLPVSGDMLTLTKVNSFYTHPKIWLVRIQKMRWQQRLVCGFDTRTNSAGMKTLQVIVSTTDNLADLKYLVGILASRLINFWCLNYLADDMNQSYLEKLPIRTIDFSNRSDKAKYNKMVSFVEQMLELNKKLAGIKNPEEKTRIQRQIDATDSQIDKLVYDLYGLTEEEIKIVESSSR
jgi:predicted type IV restriction endonuclease